jgi:coenzyme F420-reducing hydrogenase beta subunit
MACLNVCPVDSISLQLDTEGFCQPIIDDSKCIKCGKCSLACPILNPISGNFYTEPLVYAAWNKDESVLKKSSSGGVFGALCNHILNQGGVVFGAAFDENQVVIHIEITTLDGIDRLHGSKYVQSEIGYIFRRVKDLLIDDRCVLFSGTPCQVAGLYGFLEKKDYVNLYTCDVVCHGVPSPGVFKDYVLYLEAKFKKKIEKIEMRNKENGWKQSSGIKFSFKDKSQIIISPSSKDPFLNGFLNSVFLRKSCYECRFASIHRKSDLTLGDFWGIGNEYPFEFPKNQGISLVLINSEKGKRLFSEIEPFLFYWKRPILEAVKGNPMLSQRWYKNTKRIEFFNSYKTKAFSDLAHCFLNKKRGFKERLKTIIVILVGKEIIKKAKRFIEKI